MRTSIICAGNLGAEFIKASVRHGHNVRLVASSDSKVKTLCSHLGIKCESNLSMFYKMMQEETLDLLFSIINPKLTPDWVLKIPKFGAFNYHDSLLPKHRGVHATAWALWCGDTEIGYSWHEMKPAVDSGDLLHQSVIPLDGTETSYIANLKVFTRVVREFSLVLNKLDRYVNGELSLVSQKTLPMSNQNVVGLHKASDKPSEFDRMIHPGTDSSADLLRKSRALNFGPTEPIFGSMLYPTPEGAIPCFVTDSINPTYTEKHFMPVICADDKIIFLELGLNASLASNIKDVIQN